MPHKMKIHNHCQHFYLHGQMVSWINNEMKNSKNVLSNTIKYISFRFYYNNCCLRETIKKGQVMAIKSLHLNKRCRYLGTIQCTKLLDLSSYAVQRMTSPGEYLQVLATQLLNVGFN